MLETLMAYLSAWWTPVFVVLFVAVIVYALWPRNRKKFDAASKMPLRDD